MLFEADAQLLFIYLIYFSKLQKFSLMTAFPKKVRHCGEQLRLMVQVLHDGTQTLEAAGLTPNAVLHVKLGQ